MVDAVLPEDSGEPCSNGCVGLNTAAAFAAAELMAAGFRRWWPQTAAICAATGSWPFSWNMAGTIPSPFEMEAAGYVPMGSSAATSCSSRGGCRGPASSRSVIGG